MKSKPNLKVLRQRIDHIDKELLRLLNLRGRASQSVGALKAETSLAVFSPERERELLARFAELDERDHA